MGLGSSLALVGAGSSSTYVPPIHEEWGYYFEITTDNTLVSNANSRLAYNLGNAPASFWTNVRDDGGDIRVSNDAGDFVARDLAGFDFYEKKGWIFFKTADLSTSVNKTYRIYYGNPSATNPANTDALGRNIVWNADYTAVWHLLKNLNDATGNGYDTGTFSAGNTLYYWTVRAVSPDVNVHQGVAWDGTFYYLFDTNAIRKYDSSWNLVLQNVNPLGDLSASLNHFGDGDIYDGKLYITVENWTSCPSNSDQHIAIFNAADLTYVSEHNISAQAHESSGLVVRSDIGEIIVCSYCQSKLYRYDLSTFAYLGSISFSSTIDKVQGVTFKSNIYYISEADTSSILRVKTDGTIIDTLFKRSSLGTYEGICTKGDKLLLLIDPGTVETIYEMEYAGGLFFPSFSTGNLRITVPTSLTTFYLEAYFTAMDDVQRSIVGYVDINHATSTNRRQTIAIDDGDKLAIWDSTNSWLYPSPAIDPALEIIHQTGMRYESSGNTRQLVYNGVQKASGSITGQPTPRQTIFVGADDKDANEVFFGTIKEVRLRTTYPSTDYLLTDYNTMNNPAFWTTGVHTSNT